MLEHTSNGHAWIVKTWNVRCSYLEQTIPPYTYHRTPFAVNKRVENHYCIQMQAYIKANKKNQLSSVEAYAVWSKEQQNDNVTKYWNMFARELSTFTWILFMICTQVILVKERQFAKFPDIVVMPRNSCAASSLILSLYRQQWIAEHMPPEWLLLFEECYICWTQLESTSHKHMCTIKTFVAKWQGLDMKW